MTENEAKQFVNLVAEMRRLQIDCQKRCLGRRSSKQIKLETEVDKMIKRERDEQLDALQGKLF